MKRALSIVTMGLFAVAAQAAAAASCDDDSIKSVSSDGEIVVLMSGHVYQVDATDTVDSMLWLPVDDVLICDDIMINKDEDGEKVGVTLLK